MAYNKFRLQDGIDRLAFEGKDTEGAFLHATQRFLPVSKMQRVS